jgi:hypothetical protein
MRVIVYVEGPGDKAALNALLRPLLDRKRQEGVAIDFFESPPCDRKASMLIKVPVKAVNIILNDPESVVVALPDLHPKNKGFLHETPEQLVEGVLRNFEEALQRKRPDSSVGVSGRFKVFCLKHDLEALLLAAKDALAGRLGAAALETAWTLPVEDQDHDRPPKRVVEELFAKHNKRYRDTVDAPIILGATNYQDVSAQCPQCFRPFVEFLAGTS